MDTAMNDSSTVPIWRWFISFLLVGACWGFTTPFIRRAAVDFKPPQRTFLSASTQPSSGLASLFSKFRIKILSALFGIYDLLRSPRYAVPLLLNLTGSIWFFILVGHAELSLTVPIVNSLAFLFTVLGEWYVEGKVISRNTMVGMAFVLGGIAMCVQGKNTS